MKRYTTKTVRVLVCTRTVFAAKSGGVHPAERLPPEGEGAPPERGG